MISNLVDAKMMSWSDLLVWEKAHTNTVAIHRLTKRFPVEERFRLTDHLCRPAASVPTNIAEGKGRGRTAEFCQFLKIAHGSIEETRYLIPLSRDLSYISSSEYDEVESTCCEISKILDGLLRSSNSKLRDQVRTR